MEPWPIFQVHTCLMLLVEPPNQAALKRVVRALLDESISREEVVTWQKAVAKQCDWQLPIKEQDGYWYFYSLGFAEVLFPDDYYIRQADLQEYQLDLERVPGEALSPELTHLRTYQIDPNELRWPLATIEDGQDLMGDLPSTRGTFETRLDLVEHCHFEFEHCNYLLIKQFDERTNELMLLGNNRDSDKAGRLRSLLQTGMV